MPCQNSARANFGLRSLDVGVVHPEVRSNMHREVFGFKCPSCGESLGAELPAKTMVITCTACGLDFAVKRPAKGKDEVEEVEERRLSQMNHWRQQRSRSIHKDEKGVVDAARVKERLQARQATVAALAPVKAKGEATAQQGKGETASAAASAAAAAAAAAAGTGAASSSQEVSARDR